MRIATLVTALIVTIAAAAPAEAQRRPCGPWGGSCGQDTVFSRGYPQWRGPFPQWGGYRVYRPTYRYRIYRRPCGLVLFRGTVVRVC